MQRDNRFGMGIFVDRVCYIALRLPLVTMTQSSVYVVSLGCPKNLVDTEVMMGDIVEHGYQFAESAEQAEIIVVNTCGFIDAAKEESVDTILEMVGHRTAGDCKQLIVTGCMVQRYGDELAESIPEVDHYFGSADYHRVGKVFEKRVVDSIATNKEDVGKRKKLPVLTISDTPEYLYDHTSTRVHTSSRHSVYVKIAEGCDRPCGFCIIPKLRGPQRSRPVSSIVTESRKLAESGTKEVNLIAQDLTRYGYDIGKGTQTDTKTETPTLARLLRELTSIASLPWVRLHYTYPTAFSDDLISVIAEENNVLPYIDCPMQHVDDAVLKKMRRGHTKKQLYGLIEKLRARVSDLVLRTTLIVGHPGETEKAFLALCDFVQEVGFDRLGVFPYSPEPGTASAELTNDVPRVVALERQAHILELQKQVSLAKCQRQVGSTITVLVDGVSEESDLLLQGRWYGQAPGVDGHVILTDGAAEIGSFVTATVTQASEYDLVASIVPAQV